ncbi:hypothetical protein HY745_08400 [Candidatus Desantisbacteria bacterium]|nr:hypothetical protein [Candidatus Desantisbacteria bacterium]
MFLLDVLLHRCPIALLNEKKQYIYEVNEMINLYVMCENLKCLPDSGGMLNQSAHIYQIFRVISNTMNEINNYIIKRPVSNE